MQEKETENTCRFCHFPSTDTDILFHPCKCQGTIRYIHGTCLEKWLKQINKEQCELCNFKYEFNYIYDKQMTVFKFLRNTFVNLFCFFVKHCRVYGLMLVPAWLFLSFGYAVCVLYGIETSFPRIFGLSMCIMVLTVIFLEVLSVSQDAIKIRAEKEAIESEKKYNKNKITNIKERIEDMMKGLEHKCELAKSELEQQLKNKIGNPITDTINFQGNLIHNTLTQEDETKNHSNIIKNEELGYDMDLTWKSIGKEKNKLHNFEDEAFDAVNMTLHKNIPDINVNSEDVENNNDALSSNDSTTSNSTSYVSNEHSSPYTINGINHFDLQLPTYGNTRPQVQLYDSFFNFDAEQFLSHFEQTLSDFFDALKTTSISQIHVFICKFIKIASILHIISFAGIHIPIYTGIYLSKKIIYTSKFTYFLHELNIYFIWKAVTIIFLGYSVFYIVFLLLRRIISNLKIRKILTDYLGAINIIITFYLVGVLAPLLSGTLINLWINESFNYKYLFNGSEIMTVYFTGIYRCIIVPFLPIKGNPYDEIRNLCGANYKRIFIIYSESKSTNYLAFFLRIFNKYAIDTIALNYVFGILISIVFFVCRTILKEVFRNGFFYSHFFQDEKEDNMYETIFSNASFRYFAMLIFGLNLYLILNYIAYGVFKLLLSDYKLIFTFNSPTKVVILIVAILLIMNYHKGLYRFYVFSLRSVNYILGLFTNMNNALFGSKSDNTDYSLIKWRPNKNVHYSKSELNEYSKKPVTEKDYVDCYNKKDKDKRFMLFYIPINYDLRLSLHVLATAMNLYLCTKLLRNAAFGFAFILRRFYLQFTDYLSLITPLPQTNDIITKNIYKYKHMDIFVLISLIPLNWIFEFIYCSMDCYKKRNFIPLKEHFNYSFTIFISYSSIFVYWPLFFFLTVKITCIDVLKYYPTSSTIVSRNVFICCISYSILIKCVLRICDVLPDLTNQRSVDLHRQLIFAYNKRLTYYCVLPYIASLITRKYLGDIMTRMIYIIFICWPCNVLILRNVYKGITGWITKLYKDIYNYAFLLERKIINQYE